VCRVFIPDKEVVFSQGSPCFRLNIWVTNYFDDTVTKLRAIDGDVQGTFNVGDRPYGMAFDGANIWVANYGSNTVTKL